MARTLTEHESIRRWAESHGASPACVRGTGSQRDPGILRLDFEGYTGGDSLAHISWDDWFRKFEQNHLALVVDDGGRSNFNKLVQRNGASNDASAAASDGSRRRSASPGTRREEPAPEREPGGDSRNAADEDDDEFIDDEDDAEDFDDAEEEGETDEV